jgi:YVTN family beta-propeller protein
VPTASPVPTPTPIPPCTVGGIDLASNTVTGNITVGHAPFAVAVAPSSGFAYVTNRDDATVSLINTVTDTVIEDLQGGTTPEGIFVGFGQVYVTL